MAEWIPSLPELLRECNARLGITQVAFADMLGKDPSEVSKILNGKTSRPQDATLMQIAAAYQRAGLDMSFDRLAAARDSGRAGQTNAFGVPDHWLRLVLRITTEDQDTQDTFFESFSYQYERFAALLRRSK